MKRPNLLYRFFALPNHYPAKALGMTILTTVVASVAVSTAVALLQPVKDARVAAEREIQMQQMLTALPGLEYLFVSSGADSLQTKLIDLASGDFNDTVDPQQYDYISATRDPELSEPLTAEIDIAGIGRRAYLAPVHLLQSEENLLLIVLPVYGIGYQSTIRAWLALASDLTTVEALQVTEQAETPGYGSRITDPDWQAQWRQKQVFNAAGKVVIEVAKGNAGSPHQVDGISGATRTSTGVGNIVQFWLGEHGFGPFLNRLKSKNRQVLYSNQHTGRRT